MWMARFILCISLIGNECVVVGTKDLMYEKMYDWIFSQE